MQYPLGYTTNIMGWIILVHAIRKGIVHAQKDSMNMQYLSQGIP